jgi:nucleotide-binding universal stress UspA family protein
VLDKILVPVRGDGKGDNVLAHAAALAHRFGSHIEVAHCRARPEDMMPFGVPLPSFVRDQFLKQSQVLANEVEKGMREELHALAARLGLSETDPPHGGSATVSFVEEQGRMVDVIKSHGRLADLIAVPKPDRDRNIGSNSLKAALFRTGRPVMMCPDTAEVSADLGASLTLGWNGSMEASRAVALTMDLIAKATRVTILAGKGAEPHGATTEDLVGYLALHGVTAEVRRFSAKNPGAALLSETKAAGATMLVMGAYGDSHERETLFGGNTQTVVDDADIPVVMVH